MIKLQCIYLALVLMPFFSSCKKNDADETNPGKIVLNFEHFTDGENLIFDKMNYSNAAGNQYEITEIQWFISDITLNEKDGSKLILGGEKFAHYIDTNLPETFNWELTDDIPSGDYQSISMTFGIMAQQVVIRHNLLLE